MESWYCQVSDLSAIRPICSLCFTSFNVPGYQCMQLNCWHIFCHYCLQESLHGSLYKCPFDVSPLSPAYPFDQETINTIEYVLTNAQQYSGPDQIQYLCWLYAQIQHSVEFRCVPCRSYANTRQCQIRCCPYDHSVSILASKQCPLGQTCYRQQCCPFAHNPAGPIQGQMYNTTTPDQFQGQTWLSWQGPSGQTPMQIQPNWPTASSQSPWQAAPVSAAPSQSPWSAAPTQFPQSAFPVQAPIQTQAMQLYTPPTQRPITTPQNSQQPPGQRFQGNTTAAPAQFPQSAFPVQAPIQTQAMQPYTPPTQRPITTPQNSQHVPGNHPHHQRVQGTPTAAQQPQGTLSPFQYHKYPKWFAGQNLMQPSKVVLNTQDPNYIKVAALFHKTSPQKTVVQIERIQSKRLYTSFAFKHEAYSQNEGKGLRIMMLFHGTRRHPPDVIFGSDTGLDNRLGHGAWGQGTYYAEKSSYSVARYGHKLPNGSEQIFCCLVIIGNCIQLPSDTTLVRPPPIQGTQRFHHSVKGSEGGSDIYITYEPAMSYPYYLITFQ